MRDSVVDRCEVREMDSQDIRSAANVVCQEVVDIEAGTAEAMPSRVASHLTFL